METSYARFSGELKRNRIRMEKLFSFDVIVGWHGSFRNVTPHITEKGLMDEKEIFSSLW